jgi:hypothetical protein
LFECLARTKHQHFSTSDPVIPLPQLFESLRIAGIVGVFGVFHGALDRNMIRFGYLIPEDGWSSALNGKSEN